MAPPPDDRTPAPGDEPEDGLLTLPSPMTLAALQAYVARAVRVREFTTDLNEVFILLTEELGELARELRPGGLGPGGLGDSRRDGAQTDHAATRDGSRAHDNLAFELADLLLYLLDVANGFGADLTALWPAREQALSRRFGAAPLEPPFDGGWSLNALVARVEAARLRWGFEDSPEALLAGLTEEVGEIAKELRKHWKGLTTPERAGHEVLDALHYVLRLTHILGVDLEEAVREKEARNAQRTWSY